MNSTTKMEEQELIEPVIKKEDVSSEHEEKEPILMIQNIKKETGVYTLFEGECDFLKTCDEEIDIKDTSKCCIRDKNCNVKEEDEMIECFKTQIINLGSAIKVDSSNSQDVKFSIDIKEHSIENLVNKNDITRLSTCAAEFIDDVIEEVKLRDSRKRSSLYDHIQTKNSKNDLTGKYISSDQLPKNKSRKQFKDPGCEKIKRHINMVQKVIKDLKSHDSVNRFAQKSNLEKQITNINRGVKKYCHSESDFSTLKGHVIHKSIRENNCGKCQKSFSTVAHLKRHINVVHKGIKDYNCAKCQKRFSTMSELKSHVKSVHKGIKDYNCGECQKRFYTTSALKNHVNIVHKGIKNYNCGECLKKLSTMSSLKHHIYVVHRRIKDYNCGECEKSYFTVTELKRHVNVVHKGIKNYNCGECQKKLSTMFNLKNHIYVVHSDIKNYCCGECEKRFHTVSQLKCHVNVVHNCIKDFNCGECQKRFSRVSHLKRHINVVHQGINDYNCNECGK